MKRTSKRATGEATQTGTRTVVYVRVSSEKQAETGVSLDAQRARCEAYATLYGLDVVEVVVDAAESAKTLHRHGLTRALGMLRSGAADALLVSKLDRLTRSVRDLGTLVDDYFGSGRAALLSVSEQVDTRTPGGRLVLNVLGAVSQWEREAIGERTSIALQHKAERGEYIGGGAPFGYRVQDGRVIEDEAEQAVIGHARALRASGLTLRAVAARLVEAGHVSRTGRPFFAAQVARMVA